MSFGDAWSDSLARENSPRSSASRSACSMVVEEPPLSDNTVQRLDGRGDAIALVNIEVRLG